MGRKKIPENYEKTKQSLIQATIELMVTKSITNFNLSEVAEMAGITKAAIYWYFKSKNALVEEVAHTIYKTYVDYAEEIAAGTESSSQKLRFLILGREDTIQTALMCLFPIKFFLEYYSYENEIRNLVQKGYEKYNALIQLILAEGIKCGEFHTTLSLNELTKLITAAIDGLAFQNLLLSTEKIEVPRSIIFSMIESLLSITDTPN